MPHRALPHFHAPAARGLAHLVALCFMAPLFLAACHEERKVDVAANLDGSHMATMTTRDVATFITDSGITQYKIVSPVWYVYDNIDTPYWSFPEGLYLQKFDRKYNVIASVAADSAKYYKYRKLWKLDGNVEMTQAPKDIFLTQQLFWDERNQRIYSDSFIHVETATHVLEGFGFESDSRLQVYRVLKPTGIFPVNNDAERKPRPGSPQSIAAAPIARPDAPASLKSQE